VARKRREERRRLPASSSVSLSFSGAPARVSGGSALTSPTVKDQVGVAIRCNHATEEALERKALHHVFGSTRRDDRSAVVWNAAAARPDSDRRRWRHARGVRARGR
jgi:hypothetical protein